MWMRGLLAICLVGGLVGGIMISQVSGPSWGYATILAASQWPSETTGPSAAEAVEFGSDETYYAINMDAGEMVQFTIPRMPQDYATGTPIYVRIMSFSTTGTGTNTWKVKAQALGNGDALSGTWGSTVSISDAIGSTNTHYISDESGAITLANSPEPGDAWQLNIELDVENSTVTYYHGLEFKYHSTR